MRTLYCTLNLSHNRFVQEIDGGYHRVRVLDACKTRCYYENTMETPVEFHPIRCDVCNAPTIDLEDERTLKSNIKLLMRNLDERRVESTLEQRQELLAALKTVHNTIVLELLNKLGRSVWHADDMPETQEKL